MFLGQRRLWEKLSSAWWMMVLPSATAHLNSPVIILAVRACGEESTLMNPIPAELTGLPRFSSLMLLEASFYPPLSFLPYHSSFFFSLHTSSSSPIFLTLTSLIPPAVLTCPHPLTSTPSTYLFSLSRSLWSVSPFETGNLGHFLNWHDGKTNLNVSLQGRRSNSHYHHSSYAMLPTQLMITAMLLQSWWLSLLLSQPSQKQHSIKAARIWKAIIM